MVNLFALSLFLLFAGASLPAILIHLFIVVLIGGLVYWLINYMIGVLPIPALFGKILQILLVIIVVVCVIYALLPLMEIGT